MNFFKIKLWFQAVQSVARDNAGSLRMGPDQIKQKQAEALEKMSDVFEEATEDFFRTHPDPFDERAPHSISPGCKLGLLQKSLSGIVFRVESSAQKHTEP